MNVNPKVWDVIIVGASVAGLSCANALMGSDLSVLVLEKNSSVGQKICSAGLTAKSLRFIKPRSKPCKISRKIKLGTAKRSLMIDFNQTFMQAYSRKEIEETLLTRLLESSNIKALFNQRVATIEKNAVITNSGRFLFKRLIGADGAFSFVRRHLKIPTKKNAVVYHILVPKVPDHDEFHFLPEVFPKGFGYVFSRKIDGKVYTIIGGVTQAPNPDIRVDVEEWIKQTYNIDPHKYKTESTMGNFDYRGWNFGNIFLIGEAAGLVDPIIGEGMYYANQTGSACGKYLLSGNDRHMRTILRVLRIRRKLHNYIHTKHHVIQKLMFASINYDNPVTRNLILKPFLKWLVL